MGKEFSRLDRIAQLISRQLAALIQKEVQDPRLGMVTISHVKVSPDLSRATVFITVLNDADREGSLKALNSAAGYLRTLLAKTSTIRTLPALKFVFDEAHYRGMRISSLIEKNLPQANNDPDDDKNAEE